MQQFRFVFYVEDVNIKIKLFGNFFNSFCTVISNERTRRRKQLTYIIYMRPFVLLRQRRKRKKKSLNIHVNIYVCVYQKGHADVIDVIFFLQ